jgi:hypothetical protein
MDSDMLMSLSDDPESAQKLATTLTTMANAYGGISADDAKTTANKILRWASASVKDWNRLVSRYPQVPGIGERTMGDMINRFPDLYAFTTAEGGQADVLPDFGGAVMPATSPPEEPQSLMGQLDEALVPYASAAYHPIGNTAQALTSSTFGADEPGIMDAAGLMGKFGAASDKMYRPWFDQWERMKGGKKPPGLSSYLLPGPLTKQPVPAQTDPLMGAVR